MNKLYPEELEVIEHIIDRSRREEEMFLPDSKTAAYNIMQYLHKNGNLTAKVVNIPDAAGVKEVYY